MMQQIQEMQACMKDIDQTKMGAFGQHARQVDAEIKSLCASGKRDAAQSKAVSFGKRFEKDPNMQMMKKCSKKMQGMMKKLPFMEWPEPSSKQHVCD